MTAAPQPPRFPSCRFALALAAVLAAQRTAAEPVADSQLAAQSGAALGVDLYHSLSQKGGNLFFSPYSISEMVALLSAGAGGKTRDELLHALHWDQPAGRLPDAFREQDDLFNLAARRSAILQVANGLWFQNGDAPIQAFLDAVRDDFRAEVRGVDFVTGAPAVRLEINAWVGQKTLGKINDLVPGGALGPLTKLALVNAVYFKGQWEYPFKPDGTASGPFFVAPDRSVRTTQMSETEDFKVASAPSCELLELPYLGGLSMVILLPTARDGLSALEQGLSASSLAAWLASLDSSRSQHTHVTLPKFEMVYSVGLIDALRRAGIVEAFDPQGADFSGINGRRDLHVSAVYHKAYIDVNEEGTEAAASTFVGVATFAVEISREFRVDHPFLFLIRDNTTGSLLFLGRFTDPVGPEMVRHY
jgi:serpin B